MALGIPEVILLIQEQLDKPSLQVSLRISRLWYHTGHHLIWQSVDWDNTLEGSIQEGAMLIHSYRIKTLRCMFHSQASTSNVDSSSLVRSFTESDDTTMHDTSKGWSVPKKRLQHLFLKGHFDLQTAASNSARPTYISFNIPTLTRLEIRPSVNTAVDIHLILDSAVRLEHLVVCSHGAFVSSKSFEEQLGEALPNAEGTLLKHSIHQSLLSITIQHLKISRMELEGVAARCPNLIEFQSICSPGTLWKERPPSPQDQQPQHVEPPVEQPQQQQQFQQLTQSESLIRALAITCPNIRRFNVGLQQGGFHLESIRETLTYFPRLESLGLPALDCTKVTMDSIKSIQNDAFNPVATLPRALSSSFLTSLCIMNVCSSEKVSQAIHDFLSWTPYLKEFYAYNTTLYVEQMQVHNDATQSGYAEQGATSLAAEDNQVHTPCQHGSQTRRQTGHQEINRSGVSPLASTAASISPTADSHTATTYPTRQYRQWACTNLEKLVIRFAHLPWRNLSDPPRRSKDTFSFLKPLQNLKHLCIKEGLMLEAGREYDALAELAALEELVFTTCYPIPIKPADMNWLDRDDINHSVLKKIVVRRQKANASQDKEMSQWILEHRPGLKFSFELTDCCEEEYSFQ
ncbi:hypothetical protein BGX26_000813 [Mortierella sp. AD094]|nr:hypothetical protein BGX26_000813 [Mortierella sp. AD094]